MSIYFYAPRLYIGTAELIHALNGKRLVKHDGMHFRYKGTPITFGKSDAIVCWGAHVPPVDGVLMLNGSYKHQSQLALNMSMSNMPQTHNDIVPISIRAINPVSYAQVIAENFTPEGKLKGRPACGYVAYAEFPGYGVEHHRFTRHAKVTLFDGKVIGSGKPNELEVNASRQMLEHFGLLFGTVSVSMLGTTAVIRKIITSPTLDAEDVKTFAQSINHWLDKKNEVRNAIIDIANLL
jgi:hypothetical protein